jgi:hypothetical protein
MSRKNPSTREVAVPAAISALAETNRLVWRRSSVFGSSVPAPIPGGTTPPRPPGSGPGGLTLGVDVSDIKSLCRRGAERG